MTEYGIQHQSTRYKEIVVFIENGMPSCTSFQQETVNRTPFLTLPGVAMIARPQVDIAGIGAFLADFNSGFSEYLDDPSDDLTDAEHVCKTAGQLCYMSFGPNRTMNAEVGKYLKNIKSSGHGSVLEHANFTFLFYGVSRSLTHELVRHRHFSYSQVSQRYVSGRVLRFVERPEYVADRLLHQAFCDRIDYAAGSYELVAQRLLAAQQDGSEILSAEQKTEARKKVNQAARSLLPNETEAPVIVTGNLRAWRHFLEQRASPHAEVEIRALAFRVFLCFAAIEQHLFDDYRIVDLPDGTYAVETDYRKV
jgi:thymidylate synthase (FAD)